MGTVASRKVGLVTKSAQHSEMTHTYARRASTREGDVLKNLPMAKCGILKFNCAYKEVKR